MRLLKVLAPRASLALGACLSCFWGVQVLVLAPAKAQPLGSSAPRYSIGSVVWRDIWVDSARGNDRSSGATRAQALRSLDAAWRRVPMNRALSVGYRISLCRGEYAESLLPGYMEDRRGSKAHPILIRAVDGLRSAVLRGDLNIFNCSYLYLDGLAIVPRPGGDTLHLEKCDHILVRGLLLNGGRWAEGSTAPVAHDNFKANQSRHIYVEDCEVLGAEDNAIDFVAVQYGHAVRNRIHNAQDWGFYLKGGSAYFTIEGNQIWDCGTGGFTAGQGTGFQFMTAPWLHYEAYDLKVINNLIHDCRGAGLGVNGGYNILMAHNTLVRMGSRSHAVEFVFGLRSCDGSPGDEGRDACGTNLRLGGWGTTRVDNGENAVRIPNRNVFFVNNIVYNPRGFAPGDQIFSIPAAWRGASQAGSNVPLPARADDNLVIKGNILWAGTDNLGIEGEDGCQISNATCNMAQLRSDNAIGTVEPQFQNLSAFDFRPLPNSALSKHRGISIPSFAGNDRPARPLSPQGNLSNAINHDRLNGSRSTSPTPGAFEARAASVVMAGAEQVLPGRW